MKLKIGNNFSFLNLLRYVITNPEFGETVNTHITDKIFAKTTKNIEFIEYGKYHQFKGLSKKRREFIEVKRENLDKAEEVIVQNFNKAMRRKR